MDFKNFKEDELIDFFARYFSENMSSISREMFDEVCIKKFLQKFLPNKDKKSIEILSKKVFSKIKQLLGKNFKLIDSSCNDKILIKEIKKFNLKFNEMKVGILISSDRASKGEYSDLTVEVFKNEISKYLKNVELIYKIVPDEFNDLENAMLDMINKGVNILFTSGGTGLGKRDIVPEVTKKIIDKEIPGIGEAIRAYSIQYSKHAMLSRGTAGIKKQTLIINLPGSPKAVEEILSYIIEPILHGYENLSR